MVAYLCFFFFYLIFAVFGDDFDTNCNSFTNVNDFLQKNYWESDLATKSKRFYKLFNECLNPTNTKTEFAKNGNYNDLMKELLQNGQQIQS